MALGHPPTSGAHTPTESAPLAQSQLRLCLVDGGDEPGAYGEIDVGAQVAIGRDRIGTSAVYTGSFADLYKTAR